MLDHDWWVYRKTAKVAHAVPLAGTKPGSAGKLYMRHDGTAACGMGMWIYAHPVVETADGVLWVKGEPKRLRRCPKCVTAIKKGGGDGAA